MTIITKKVCKFPAGTKSIRNLNRNYIGEDGRPVSDIHLFAYYDKDGKECKRIDDEVFINEDGETRMRDEVISGGYTDYDGKLKLGPAICTSTFEIPSSVCSITEINGEYTSLHVTVFNTVPPTVGKVVNLSKDDMLLVPKESLKAYKNDAKWGKFKNISGFDMDASSSQPATSAASATSDLEERLKKIEARLAALEAKMK